MMVDFHCSAVSASAEPLLPTRVVKIHLSLLSLSPSLFSLPPLSLMYTQMIWLSIACKYMYICVEITTAYLFCFSLEHFALLFTVSL